MMIVIAWFVVATAAVGIAAYWYFEPSRPPMEDFTLEFQDEHGNTKLDFRAAEKLYSHGKFTVTREFRRTLTRSLVNTDTGQIIAIYAPQVEIFKPNKYERTFPVTIPVDVRPGNYHFVFTLTYELNPLQPSVPIIAPQQPFRVVP